MKKMFPLVLLAASMSFASLKVMGTNCIVSYPSFKLVNETNKSLKNFSVYVYQRVCKTMEGLKVQGNVAGANVSMQRMNADTYRIKLDFKDVKIAAGETFPKNGNYLGPVIVTSEGKRVCPHPLVKVHCPTEDYDLSYIVVVSSSGEILHGEDRDFTYGTRVGVLRKDPDSYCNGDLSITLDTEDHNPSTKIVYGDHNPPGITIKKKSSITFNLCYQYDTPRVPFDYVVLQMDNACPEGTYPYVRYHDTEDDNNKNDYKGDIWPSEVFKDARLRFCFVPKDESSSLKYPYNKEYGVFANYSAPHIERTQIHIDDEDSNNESFWGPRDTPEDIARRIHKILSGFEDTDYHVIKWNGKTLAKSAENTDAPFAAETPLVAAAPFAPAIKGLDRSAVSVELKSEGKVKVSIVNANGSVIANVAQESLQPGVHQIKWNSGMVPSGRYIVKVEQNGMVNARNVILK